MRKSSTPYYEFGNSNLQANISDDELMSKTEIFADSELKASENSIKKLLEFSASFEVQKTHKKSFTIFKN